MKTSTIFIAILAIMILALAGCNKPTCYPPNKIIGNNCCIDDNDNNECDYHEEQEQKEEPVKEEPVVETQPIEKEEPKPVVTTETKPAIQTLGKSKIVLGEPKRYIEINKLSAFRTSRDKGVVDYMLFTVRNLGTKKLNPVVELLFEGARYEEHQVRIKKEYFLQPLEPGEKMVMNQSMGVYFEGINLTKKINLAVYERYAAPRDDLGTEEKAFIPMDYMDSLEIYTFGLPEE